MEYIPFADTSIDQKEKVNDGVIFSVGTIVQKTAMYICVPCGSKKRLIKGGLFPRCLSCMKKEKFNDDDFFKNLEQWEFVEES